MPRGVRKPVNYAEEIQKIDMQITRWKNTIQELQEKRRELVEEQQRQELAALYEAVKASGRSVSDVVAQLSASSETGAA